MDFDLRDFLTTETGQVSFVSFAVFTVGWALKILYIWVQGYFQARVGEQKTAELEAGTEQLNSQNFGQLITVLGETLREVAPILKGVADQQVRNATANQEGHDETRSLVQATQVIILEETQAEATFRGEVREALKTIQQIDQAVQELPGAVANKVRLLMDCLQKQILDIVDERIKAIQEPVKEPEAPATTASEGATTSIEAVVLLLDAEGKDNQNSGEKAA